MRYAFDNRAIGFINRVHSAANKTVLSEYGRMNLTLLNMLWFEADIKSDWSADSDVAQELSIFRFMDKAWYVVIRADRKEDRPVAEAWDKAMAGILEVENRIWLATCVSNALSALEASAQNIFNDEGAGERINVEFLQERMQCAAEAREILGKFNVYQDALSV